MTRNPGKHQPQAVQQLRKCPERTADAGHSRSLAQRKRRRYVPDLLHIRPFRLRHPPARISGERFQISAGSLRMQHTKCKRGFSRAGDTGNRYDFMQRNIYIYIFQVMNLCTAYLDISRQHLFLSDFTGHNSYLFSVHFLVDSGPFMMVASLLVFISYCISYLYQVRRFF